MKPELQTFRRCFPGLSRLGNKDMQVLLESLDAMQFPAGAVVMAPGYGSGSMFLVNEGRVEIALENDDSKDAIVLGHLSAGDWFGEMALIDPAPASARVKAESDCNLLVLTHDAFMQLRRAHPDVSGKLLQVINAELARRLHQTIAHIDGVKSSDDGALASSEQKRHWFTELARRVFGSQSAGRQS